MKKKIIIGIECFFIAIFFVFIFTQNGSASGETLSSLLDNTYMYGVFSNETEIKNDFESNLATNKLKIDGTYDIGTSTNKSTIDGDMYIGNFIKGKLQLRNANYIYLGSDFTITENKYTANNGGIIDISNSKNTVIVKDVKHENIEKDLNKLNDKFNNYVGKNTEDIFVNFIDINNSIIDVTDCKETNIYLSIDYSVYKKIAIGGLKIKKNNNQIVIFSLCGLENYLELEISRYFINTTSSVNDDIDISDSIIWNIPDYNGDIKISEICGTIIAPKANVITTSTCRGRIICNKYSNPGGEHHFLYNGENKTEKPTVTPTSKPTPTVKVTATPRQTETIKPTSTTINTISNSPIPTYTTSVTVASESPIVSEVPVNTNNPISSSVPTNVAQTKNPELITIDDNGVPKSGMKYKDKNKKEDNTIIEDNMIPLTGDSVSVTLLVALLLLSFLAMFIIVYFKHKDKK